MDRELAVRPTFQRMLVKPDSNTYQRGVSKGLISELPSRSVAAMGKRENPSADANRKRRMTYHKVVTGVPCLCTCRIIPTLGYVSVPPLMKLPYCDTGLGIELELRISPS